VCFLVHYFTAQWSNSKKDAAIDVLALGDGVGVSVDSYHTEKQDHLFRYSY